MHAEKRYRLLRRTRCSSSSREILRSQWLLRRSPGKRRLKFRSNTWSRWASKCQSSLLWMMSRLKMISMMPKFRFWLPRRRLSRRNTKNTNSGTSRCLNQRWRHKSHSRKQFLKRSFKSRESMKIMFIPRSLDSSLLTSPSRMIAWSKSIEMEVQPRAPSLTITSHSM